MQNTEVLRSHRGLTKLKRVKAVFWWCYLHVECPKTMADTLREMPTDADVDLLRERLFLIALFFRRSRDKSFGFHGVSFAA